MGTLTAHGVSVDEYLSNPAYEHFEFVGGAVRELNIGTGPHSMTQAGSAFVLALYLRSNRIGFAYTGLTCKLPAGPRVRFYRPDVCVVLGERKTGRYLEGAPDLAVEVRSPDDTMSEAVRKMQDWLAAGSRLGWLLLPEEQALWIFKPGEPPHVLGAEDQAGGADLLPGLAFRVRELFEQ